MVAAAGASAPGADACGNFSGNRLLLPPACRLDAGAQATDQYFRSNPRGP